MTGGRADALTFRAYLQDEGAMDRLAAAVGRAMPQESPLVVYLQGDLGTGKTTFARSLLRFLGEAGPVRSPTYGLMSEYTTPAGRVLHVDLYRIRSPSELSQLGLADYLADSRLWLIEWPEKAQGRLPVSDLCLRLEVQGSGRGAQIEPTSQAGQRWLAEISAGQTS